MLATLSRRATLLAVIAVMVWIPHGSAQKPGYPDLGRPEVLWTTEATSPFGMVVSSSREASWAGVEILESGGNAIDAAVATALAAGVAEPGSSGLGGQTLMLIVLADGRAIAVDGAGAAPRRADREHLWTLEQIGGRWLAGREMAAVPGTLAALSLALESYGTKSLAEVLDPAIELAELGFTVPLYEHAFVKKYTRTLRTSPELCRVFLDDCFDAPEPGRRYCLPDLACALRWLARHGAQDFYRGAIARMIEEDMIENGGSIRRDDLAMMRATEKEPLRGSYRGFEVLSFPYPGGGAAVIEALHILEQFPTEMLRAWNTDRLHLLAEAVRLALADTLPRAELLFSGDRLAQDKRRAATRAGLIRFDRALTREELGDESLTPWEGRDTTHITVADAHGNVVSLTQTLGSTFGCGAVTPGLGFPYNSLLKNYDLAAPQSPAYLRPRTPPYSNMAPTIVLKDGKPFLALGSAGSGRIASAIVEVVSNVIDQGAPLCEAVTAPRVQARAGTWEAVMVEVFAPVTAADANELDRRGFPRLFRRFYTPEPEVVSYWGSTNTVLIDPADGTLVGVGDPHRQGVALGATRLDGTRRSPVASLPCYRELLATTTPATEP